jgi:ubiquinone/menaquinone biosynthesis C-methylase UbiE
MDKRSSSFTVWASRRKEIRKGDINTIFGNWPINLIGTGLELGAGDGYQSALLSKYVRTMISAEYNKTRLPNDASRSNSRHKFVIADAELLPFKLGSFDLIFSSSVLEHIPDRKTCLKELDRVLGEDGLMVHVMPNRLWKILNILLFYPFGLYVLINNERRRFAFQKFKFDPLDNNQKTQRRNRFSNIFPSIHGTYSSHFSEFIAFGRRRWVREFEDQGFVVHEIKKLCFSSSYRFGLNGIRKVLERLGIVTSYAYIASKNSSPPEWFSEDPVNTDLSGY